MLGSPQGWNNQPINSRKADKALCWAVLGHAVLCRMVQSPWVLGFMALPQAWGS